MIDLDKEFDKLNKALDGYAKSAPKIEHFLFVFVLMLFWTSFCSVSYII